MPFALFFSTALSGIYVIPAIVGYVLQVADKLS